jgi:hypothetical protein
MRWFIKVPLFVVCFFATARFCKIQTGSFTIPRITCNLPYQSMWETASPSPEELASIKQTLQQPYSYLAKGAQSFVFASEDGRYVIKFFRYDHLKAPFWLDMLPFQWARDKAAKKNKKLDKDFASYKLAYEEFKEETGLLYLHLNKTSDLNMTLDLVDKLGIHHPMRLDQYEFLVQKKADLVYPAIQQMMQKGEPDKARDALAKLVHLIARRARQGISDKDPDLNTNFGFIGTDPIQIDMGRYKKSDRPFHRNEIIRITDNLHQWLMVRYPELDLHLKTQIDSL